MADGESYAFTYAGVHEAPNASGVYTIYSPQRWVYVGESDDIRQSLFHLLNDSPVWIDHFGPLSFSFERLPPVERSACREGLVEELSPAQHSDSVHYTHDGAYSSPRRPERRACLTALRTRFEASRSSRTALRGLVGRRFVGGLAARCRSPTSRA